MSNVSPQLKLTVLLLLLVALMFCSFLLGAATPSAHRMHSRHSRAGWDLYRHRTVHPRSFVMGRVAHIGNLGIPGKKDQRIADDAIEMLGIAHLSQKIFIRADLRGQTART